MCYQNRTTAKATDICCAGQFRRGRQNASLPVVIRVGAETGPAQSRKNSGKYANDSAVEMPAAFGQSIWMRWCIPTCPFAAPETRVRCKLLRCWRVPPASCPRTLGAPVSEMALLSHSLLSSQAHRPLATCVSTEPIGTVPALKCGRAGWGRSIDHHTAVGRV
jgi:hypothetical protein